MKTITETLKDEARAAFLKRSPLNRAETMHHVIMDVIALIAKGEGATDYEVYKRYLTRRDKKLARLLEPPEASREPKEMLESQEEIIKTPTSEGK
jgi:hypothetical protein